MKAERALKRRRINRRVTPTERRTCDTCAQEKAVSAFAISGTKCQSCRNHRVERYDGIAKKECPKCEVLRPLDHFPALKRQYKGVGKWCRRCRGDKKQKKYRHEGINEEVKLDGYIRKFQPSEKEWYAVERATKAIFAYLKIKASGADLFEGQTGETVLLEATSSSVRFCQLAAMATTEHQIQDKERKANLKANGRYKPDTMQEVRNLNRAGVSSATIAIRLGVSRTVVYEVLTDSRSPETP